jgi:hypothetical protein
MFYQHGSLHCLFTRVTALSCQQNLVTKILNSQLDASNTHGCTSVEYFLINVKWMG